MLHLSPRQQLYAMFSALFSYPDLELQEQLLSGRLLLPAQHLPGSQPAPELKSDNLLETLQVAFTDLFINRLGGVPAPPYGSVYLDPGQQLHGPSTQAVAAAYQAAGLVLDQTPEPPDFLATELEFLYFLTGQEAPGHQPQEGPAPQSAVAQQACFIEGFVAPWVPEFCRRIVAEPLAHPLYRWSATLLTRFCTAEQERLAGFATD